MHKSESLHIIHLLSWSPTEDNPTLGNFCLRHIQTVSDQSDSLVLNVRRVNHSIKNIEIHLQNVDNYRQLNIKIKDCTAYSKTINKLVNAYRMFKAYNYGLRYIKKHLFRPDLVHLHVALPAGKIALYWKYRYGLSYVLSEHWSIYLPQDMRLGKDKISKLLLAITNHASIIMPVNENLKRHMMDCGVKSDFQVIPNVVDTALFNIKEKNTTDKKQLLHVSSLVDKEKNFSGLLRVIKRVRVFRNDFVLNVVHSSSHQAFEQYVLENDLQDCIVFHGRKTEIEIASYYQQADFFVLFSHFENLPCVVLESFACGLPVVATKVGELPYIINKERGRLVPAGDEEALYHEINFMLDHYTEFSKTEIRKYALEHYTKENIKHQLINIYRLCIQNI